MKLQINCPIRSYFTAHVFITAWQFKVCLLIFLNIHFVLGILELILVLLLLPHVMLAKVSGVDGVGSHLLDI